jgi:hypothetical protein
MNTLQSRYESLISEANKSDLRIEVYKFSHDTCGNPTALYNVYKREGGYEYAKRRVQIGYSDDCLEGANNLLAKLGICISEYDKVLTIGSRFEGAITVYFNNCIS